MQATLDDGLWNVRKSSEQFRNQDTYQETCKDLNKIILIKCDFII